MGDPHVGGYLFSQFASVQTSENDFNALAWRSMRPGGMRRAPTLTSGERVERWSSAFSGHVTLQSRSSSASRLNAASQLSRGFCRSMSRTNGRDIIAYLQLSAA